MSPQGESATAPSAWLLWSHLGRSRRACVAAHIVAVITIGLWLDARLGWTGQHIATVWAFGIWGWLYWLGRRLERRVLLLATLLSAAGEVFLSLVWGVYDYQFSNVPLFVPPGHALLMTLGLVVVRVIEPHTARVRDVVWGVTIAGAAWGAWAWVADIDRFGTALFLLYAACVAAGVARPLYAVMFALALVMELYGTALGNWTWAARAPFLEWSAANPPYSAGALYCALDLLVLGILRRFAAGHAPPPSPISAQQNLAQRSKP